MILSFHWNNLLGTNLFEISRKPRRVHLFQLSTTIGLVIDAAERL